MVLAYLQIERSEAEISHLLGTQTFGTPSFAIRRLTQWGLEVLYQEWSLSKLSDALASGRPVITFVRTGFLDHWRRDVAHAVVVVGIAQGDHVWIHDPAQPRGPVSVSWDGFLAAWAEFGYRGAVITGPHKR